MSSVKKFVVVRLTGVSQPGKNPYKCVPRTWIRSKSFDEITVPYPTVEQLPLAINLIINCAVPLLCWPNHAATIECDVDIYEEGLLFIKQLNNTLLEEEAIIIWRRISHEVIERQGHRKSVL